MPLHPAITEIFYHMDHAERDLIYREANKNGTDVDAEAVRDAIESDATDLTDWLNQLGHDVTADQLVEAYFARGGSNG